VTIALIWPAGMVSRDIKFRAKLRHNVSRSP
jgi:hypothetical protein